MLKNLRNALVGLVSAFALVAVPLAVPSVVSAQSSFIQDCVAQGTDLKGNIDGTTCDGSSLTAASGGTDLSDVIKLIINIFSVIVGFIAVVMIIYGGLRYITSGGDSNKITSAKNTIIYALLGLIIVALAQFIVRFVLSRASGVGTP